MAKHKYTGITLVSAAEDNKISRSKLLSPRIMAMNIESCKEVSLNPIDDSQPPLHLHLRLLPDRHQIAPTHFDRVLHQEAPIYRLSKF